MPFGSLKANFVQASQNSIKSHLKFCLISQLMACMHAAEIHLHSLIGACINEYRWTMRRINGAYIDRLLDNHVVISDSRKS